MKKKIVSVCLVVCLLATAIIGTTLAYFTDETEVVKNTFTSGNVTIDLDEAKVDEYGVAAEPATRVTANSYKLVPSATYTKDPTVHVAKGSEPCYVYVEIRNSIAELIDPLLIVDGWNSMGNGVYYWNEVVDARENAVDLTVFESFTVKEDAVLTGVTSEDAITVQAFAVQTSGDFADAQAAWNATFGAPVEP